MSDTGFKSQARSVQIRTGRVTLDGDLMVPAGAWGIVLFAHGSGSSRHSRRNRRVAEQLQRAGLATLLFDLLTAGEEVLDAATAELRFNIALLADRLALATDWLASQPEVRALPVGYFGASTGGAAALVASVLRPQSVKAVVSRGGRPDLAGIYLPRVKAPTLLIVGGHDTTVIALNRQALDLLQPRVKQLMIVPGAGHLFEEPGTLDQVAELARDWFERFLCSPSSEQGRESRPAAKGLSA
ncbi:MAG TPA: dienelactone hydrolase family protein [Gemmatimonadales bacterium]|jgi:dienelactone hydrolase